jgi:carbon storage regulator
MLVLSRKQSQQIQIGSEISITVVRIERKSVRLGVSAPPDVSILRDELVRAQSPREAHDSQPRL